MRYMLSGSAMGPSLRGSGLCAGQAITAPLCLSREVPSPTDSGYILFLLPALLLLRCLAESVVSQGSFNGSSFRAPPRLCLRISDFSGTRYLLCRLSFNSGAGMQYGWVRIKWGGCSANKFILKVAWGDPGDKIKAGQKGLHEDDTQVAPQAVKKPAAVPHADLQGSLGLLALGAVGLQAWRKSRSGTTRLEDA